MRYYEKIDGSKYRNIWVVGDLHGCYTNLMNKLDTIGFDNKKDLLISVGDLVDRGAENVEYGINHIPLVQSCTWKP